MAAAAELTSSAGVPALPCPGCDWVSDKVGDAASSVAGDALQKFADAVKEDVGRVVGEVGTVWLRVPTIDPLASDGGASPTVTPGATPGGGSAGIVEVLGMASWIALGVCVLSLIVAGARMGIEARRNDGEYHMTRLMVILIAAILVSGAAALVTALMPERSSGQATVAFIENSLWYYTAAAVVLSVIVGALRMAWEQRADPGRDLVRSLLTFVVVSAGGLTVISLLLQAGDSFSRWIVSSSLDCKGTDQAACFGENMAGMLGLASTSGIGVIAVIVLGLMVFVASAVQIAMMVSRSGMLIILAGTLPLTASATNTALGKQMFQKTAGWIIALLLYKPVAAVIYAAAFQLAGSDVLGGGLKAMGQVIVGLMMMVLAVLALPALMRLVSPAVGMLASGNAAGGMAMAAGAAVPAGAVAGGKLFGGGSAVSDVGSSGAGADSGPSGSSSSGGGPSGSSSPGGGNGASDASTLSSGSGSKSGSGSGGAVAAGAGEGAAAAGSGAGAGAASGAAAAAAGPVGLAAGAASSGGGASGAIPSAAGAAQSAASGAVDAGVEGVGDSDEEEGPSGSR